MQQLPFSLNLPLNTVNLVCLLGKIKEEIAMSCDNRTTKMNEFWPNFYGEAYIGQSKAGCTYKLCYQKQKHSD